MLKHLTSHHGIKFQECGVNDRFRESIAKDAAVAATSFTMLSDDNSSFHI